jgi:hypothetical protein
MRNRALNKMEWKGGSEAHPGHVSLEIRQSEREADYSRQSNARLYFRVLHPVARNIKL